MDLNLQNYIHCTSKVVDKILKANPDLKGRKQNHKRATYSLWRDTDDYQIDWTKDAHQIIRFIDSVGDPYSGARTTIESRVIRITRAEYAGRVPIENPSVGKALWWSGEVSSMNRRPTVTCGRGLIKILEAHYDDTGASIFPTQSSRLRFI